MPAWLLGRLGWGRPYVVLIHGAELIDPGRPRLDRLKSAVLSRAAGHVVVDCAACGFAHLDPIPGEAELRAFYERHFGARGLSVQLTPPFHVPPSCQ